LTPERRRPGHFTHAKANHVSYDDYDFLHVDLSDNGIMTVTMNSPDTRNAVSTPEWAEFGRLWHIVSTDQDVKIIVLTGAGKAFCAGGNLKRFAGEENVSELSKTELSPITWRTWLSVPQPMIAAVNGDAIGFGTSLAVACDIVLSVPTARFGSPHVRLGIVPASNVSLWPALMGLLSAKEYLMTGELFPAEEARRIGLVNRIVAADELAAKASDLASQLLSLPYNPVRWTKKVLNKSRLEAWNLHYDLAQAYESMATAQPEHHAAVAKFAGR
jgi:enoyl-CoA hydratase